MAILEKKPKLGKFGAFDLQKYLFIGFSFVAKFMYFWVCNNKMGY
jgi:hypothetical protein